MILITIEPYIYFIAFGIICALGMVGLFRYGRKLNIAKVAYGLIGGLLLLLVLFLVTPYAYQECMQTGQVYLYSLLHNKIVYTVVYLLSVVTPLLLWYIYNYENFSNRLKTFLKTLILIIVLCVSFFVYWIFINPNSGIGGGMAHVANGVNRVRRYALDDLHMGLYKYFEKNKIYPKNLETLVPEYIENLPKDPITANFYDYATSSDLKDYVVRANMGVFEKGCFSQAELAPIARRLQQLDLEQDLDGKVYNLDCNDPMLCQGIPEYLKPENSK